MLFLPFPMLISRCFFFLLHYIVCFSFKFVRYSRKDKFDILSPHFETSKDDIFGAEFRLPELVSEAKQSDTIDSDLGYQEQLYWKGKAYVKKNIVQQKSAKNKEEYETLRQSFLFDSIYVSLLGLCVAWLFGTYKDAFSYGVGSILGAAYAILLSKYVRSIGTGAGGADGAARFAPVFLLVILYSKNKDSISIIPEIIGFFSYQLGSLLQIFNSNAYGSEDEENN